VKWSCEFCSPLGRFWFAADELSARAACLGH
jgi:hypothetical protein